MRRASTVRPGAKPVTDPCIYVFPYLCTCMYMYMHIPLLSSGGSRISDLLRGADVGGTDENNNLLHFGLIACFLAC